MKKILVYFLALALLVPLMPALAEETTVDLNTEVTAAELGVSEEAVNNATSEATATDTFTGTLVEIGNTTAEETTIIVRETLADGTTEDQTIEMQKDTSILNDTSQISDLSDWIAGDQITVTREKFQNSGQTIANRLRNRSMKALFRGKNGWITAIRPEENEMDVTWANQIFTLNVKDAKMVAGTKNPATINDFQVNDRIRARVVDDGDKNPATWNAKIVVVLRRGNDLFMRVTRWVVPAKITIIPEDLTLPVTIEVEVLASKFYEQGDVNNLIGAPGTKLIVDITKDTILVRRFLGRALLKEFSEGDEVRIIGRRDENSGHLVAKFLQNKSIQALGVSQKYGKIVSIDGRNLSVELLKTKLADPSVTVNVLDKAKVVKAGELVNFDEVKVNDIIRVRGVANRNTRNVDANLVSLVGQAY